MATKPAPAKAVAKTMGTKTAAAKSAKNARAATATNTPKTTRATPKATAKTRAPANRKAGPGMVYDKKLHRSVPIASGAGGGKSVRQAKATA
jgi:hypothetical protein